MTNIYFLLALNLLVAIWGAWVGGKIALQEKTHGSVWLFFVSWANLIASSISFFVVYFIFAVKISITFHFMPVEVMHISNKILHLLLALPLLSSGIIFTLEAWNYFWKKKNLSRASILSLNAYTQVQNIINLEAAWDAGEMSWDVLSNLDVGAEGAIGLLLFIISVGSGIMTTYFIFNNSKKAKHSWLKEQLLLIKEKINLQKSHFKA